VGGDHPLVAETPLGLPGPLLQGPAHEVQGLATTLDTNGGDQQGLVPLGPWLAYDKVL
jgi:hypothetical protein